MIKRSRWCAVGGLVAAVSLLGCAPRPVGPELAVFQVGTGVCAAAPGSVRVSVEPGALSITGCYLAPTPCHALHAVLITSGRRDLTLAITATALDGPCIQILGAIPYAGRIEGLPGRWRLRIFHGEDLVWDTGHDVPSP